MQHQADKSQRTFQLAEPCWACNVTWIQNVAGAREVERAIVFLWRTFGLTVRVLHAHGHDELTSRTNGNHGRTDNRPMMTDECIYARALSTNGTVGTGDIRMELCMLQLLRHPHEGIRLPCRQTDRQAGRQTQADGRTETEGQRQNDRDRETEAAR